MKNSEHIFILNINIEQKYTVEINQGNKEVFRLI